jgi:hypothetical protein
MSLDVTLYVVVPADQPELWGALGRALDEAGVRPKDRRSGGGFLKEDEGVWIYDYGLIVDDADQMEVAVRQALLDQGVNVLHTETTSKPLEEPTIQARGVVYETATGTLTVDSAGGGELVIQLVRQEDEIVAVLTSEQHGRRQSEALFDIQRIVVRRP